MPATDSIPAYLPSAQYSGYVGTQPEPEAAAFELARKASLRAQAHAQLTSGLEQQEGNSYDRRATLT